MFRRLIFILLALYGIFLRVCSQTQEELLGVGLPVICISTENGEMPTCDIVYAPENCMGQSIINNNKVNGRMQVYSKDGLLLDTGEENDGIGGMSIRVRGNSSATVKTKKYPYKIKLEDKADLLFRGDSRFQDKEWLLLNFTSDLKQMVGFLVCRYMDLPWTSSFRFVNLMMNGEYYGLYVLAESVKRNIDCRLNVDKKTGLIFEFDPYYWNEDFYIPTSLTSYKSLGWTFKYPDPDDLNEGQCDSLRLFIEEFESEIKNGNYSSVLDIQSFAKWLIGQDMLGNGDGAGSNMFLIRENDTSLVKMATLWDFDVIYSNPLAFSSIHTAPFFVYKYLFNSRDRSFVNAYYNAWESVKNDGVFESIINELENFEQSEEAQAIEASRYLDANRWGTDFITISKDVADAESWFSARKETLDDLISHTYGGECAGIVEPVKSDLAEEKDIRFSITGQYIPHNCKRYRDGNILTIRNGKKYFVK